MKAHQLLSSPETWCKESPGEDAQGNKVSALDPKAVKWCALGAIQRAYDPLRATVRKSGKFAGLRIGW
jgi:hypothetical protein